MVSGEKGWFPYGTDCSGGSGPKRSAYCVKGRCLEFGEDNTPLYEEQKQTTSFR
jgi:thrombospondin motif-containing protein 18